MRNIGRVRPYLNQNALKSLVQATVISRLDYANVLLHGLTIQLLSKLQRVQNAAARMITGAGRSEHITPSLYHLHWLPVECRVKYKILLYTYKALNNTAPVYVCNLLSRHQPGRRLRSTESVPPVKIGRAHV